jgi:hypothetical protein
MSKDKSTVDTNPARKDKYPNGFYTRVKTLEQESKLLRIELEAIKKHLNINQANTSTGIFKWFNGAKKWLKSKIS